MLIPLCIFKALLRPGRFDRHISVDLPTVVERQELFKMYLCKIKTSTLPSNLIQRLAHLTPGFTGNHFCFYNSRIVLIIP